MSGCRHIEEASGSDGSCPQCLLEIGLDASEGLTGDFTDLKTPSGGAYLPESHQFTPGTVIANRFRIVATVGIGGMGEVYRADDTKLGQQIALKFLPQRYTRDPARLDAICSEVRLGRQISHPNVCRLYELLESDESHFIVMEYVDGEDLATLLGRIGRLPAGKALEVARDICAGLAAMHAKGIAHGDLKPANVLIDGRGTARITDFGVARLTSDPAFGGVLSGTPAYMAPEQLDGVAASTTSDVYALGLVLYEIFTGRRAHDASSLSGIRSTMNSAPPRPDAIVPELDDAISRLVLRCLERDPAARPRDAREVLARIPGGDPLEAAVAAGHTPSPSLVAAASQAELTPSGAFAIFLAALALTAGGWLASGRFAIYSVNAPPQAPAVLAAAAERIAGGLSVPPPRGDRAGWFALSPAREGAADGEIVFEYRTSDAPLVPLGHDGRVKWNDPPFTRRGMTNVVVDAAGRLRYLQAIPSPRAPSLDPVGWRDVAAAAGLEADAMSEKPLTAPVPVPHDEVREWIAGNDRHRAARSAGRVVYFSSGDLDRETPAAGTSLPETVYLALLTLTLLVGAWLARRNILLGRVDHRGAIRVAAWVFVARIAAWLFTADHTASIAAELEHAATALGRSLYYAAQMWLGYMALEPYVRRRWPRTIVGWNRLVSGRLRDPIVGKEILAGSAAGAAVYLLEYARVLAPSHGAILVSPAAIETLTSLRLLAGSLFHFQSRALFFALFGLFLLVLLKALLRSRAAASVVWIALVSIAWLHGTSPAVDLPVAVVQMTIILLALTRFGLIAAASAFYFHLVLAATPLTLDPSSWFFSRGLLPLALLGALAAGALRSSLAGTRLFERPLLEPSP
jgi:hypothetical protein